MENILVDGEIKVVAEEAKPDPPITVEEAKPAAAAAVEAPAAPEKVININTVASNCKDVRIMNNKIHELLTEMKTCYPSLKSEIVLAFKAYRQHLKLDSLACVKYVSNMFSTDYRDKALLNERTILHTLSGNKTIHKFIKESMLYKITFYDFKLSKPLDIILGLPNFALKSTNIINMYDKCLEIVMSSEIAMAQLNQIDTNTKRIKAFFDNMFSQIKSDDDVRESSMRQTDEKEAPKIDVSMELFKAIIYSDNEIAKICREVLKRMNIKIPERLDSEDETLKELYVEITSGNTDKITNLTSIATDVVRDMILSKEIDLNKLTKQVNELKSKFVDGFSKFSPMLSKIGLPTDFAKKMSTEDFPTVKEFDPEAIKKAAERTKHDASKLFAGFASK